MSGIQNNTVKYPLENLSVILVGVKGPANIGSIARAMKNMGCGNLILAEPRCGITDETYKYACSSDEIIESSKTENTLKEAVRGFHRIIGTTARQGQHRGAVPGIPPRDFALKYCKELQNQKIALVFGREDSGLTNDELFLCTDIVTIPTAPMLPSLNIAQAVLIVLYEIFIALSLDGIDSKYISSENFSKTSDEAASIISVSSDRGIENFAQSVSDKGKIPPATADETGKLIEHIEKTLDLIDYYEGREHSKILLKIKGYMSKKPMASQDINVLRGILHKIEWKISSLKNKD